METAMAASSRGVGLSIGSSVRTSYGDEWTVKGNLGEGGQGYVYLIEREGVKRALKWYKAERFVTKAFYEHIKNNVNDGAPSDGYIWPLEVTEYDGNSFGYIMELCPNGYYETKEYLNKEAEFKSFKTIVDAALNIVNDLRVLHNRGYSYQDLNDGNFFINPENGKVLICDNDNVAPNGVSTGVLGKPRYMAPEIVMRNNMPDIYSDRYSMALMIFRLLMREHPLEGKLVNGGISSPDLQKSIYGDEPIFMFDPDDDRNRPDPELNSNAISIWKCLPDYMKRIFLRAFGKEGLKHPNRRPTEAEWVDVLVRFRSSIVSCECGNEVFLSDNGESICDNCGKKIDIPFWIKFPEYRIPGVKGSRIYRCQTCITDVEDALKPVGRILAAKGDDDRLGLMNMSEEEWDVTTSGDKKRKTAPGEVMPLRKGIKFSCNGTTIVIEGGRDNAANQ